MVLISRFVCSFLGLLGGGLLGSSFLGSGLLGGGLLGSGLFGIGSTLGLSHSLETVFIDAVSASFARLACCAPSGSSATSVLSSSLFRNNDSSGSTLILRTFGCVRSFILADSPSFSLSDGGISSSSEVLTSLLDDPSLGHASALSVPLAVVPGGAESSEHARLTLSGSSSGGSSSSGSYSSSNGGGSSSSHSGGSSSSNGSGSSSSHSVALFQSGSALFALHAFGSPSGVPLSHGGHMLSSALLVSHAFHEFSMSRSSAFLASVA